MKTIYLKKFTSSDLQTKYKGDTINIHDELIAKFKDDYSDKIIDGSTGELTNDGNDLFTYTIFIDSDITPLDKAEKETKDYTNN